MWMGIEYHVNLALFLGFLMIYLAVLYMLMTRIKRYFP